MSDPRALRDLPYGEYLKTEHWQAVREAACERAGYRCILCNAGGELHVHHRTYARLGEELPEDVHALCGECHEHHHRIPVWERVLSRECYKIGQFVAGGEIDPRGILGVILSLCPERLTAKVEVVARKALQEGATSPRSATGSPVPPLPLMKPETSAYGYAVVNSTLTRLSELAWEAP